MPTIPELLQYMGPDPLGVKVISAFKHRPTGNHIG